MPVIYTPYTIRVACHYTLSGQPVANVLHVTKADETAVDAADVDAVADAAINWVEGYMLPRMSNAVQLIDVTATDESSPSGLQVIDTPTSPTFGSRAVAALPGNVAFAVKFGTGLAGRSYRGRLYFLGLSEDNVTGNTVLSADAAQIIDAVAEFATAMTAVGFNHTVVSKQLNGAPRTVGVATPVTTYSYTDLTVDTQRKRLA